MRAVPLRSSLLVIVLCLASHPGRSQAQNEPDASGEQPEEALGEGPELSPEPTAEETPVDSGISFRVKLRHAMPVDAATDKRTSTSACDSVSVTLKRGNLSAQNSSNDSLLSFSDLPPGPYRYTARCASNEHGSGSVEGSADVVLGKMTMVPITIDMPARTSTVESAFTSASGTILARDIGTPDQKGGDLDSKIRSLTVLADLGYITSADTHQDIAPLAFTDLGVWSIAAAFTPQRQLTIGVKAAGLAKSPAMLDTRVMQLAGADLAYAFGRHLAVSAGGQWQAGRDTTRSLISTGGGVTWRKQHAEFVKTEFRLGAEGVMHRGTASDGNRTSTFASGSAEVQLCWNDCRRRYGATWFGFDGAIPLWHSDASAPLVGAKPNSALGFHVGSFMRVNDTFDLYADVAWRDRGDAAAIKTEFGTLLGGFDQIQMSLGAIFYFHFGKAKPQSDSDYVRAL